MWNITNNIFVDASAYVLRFERYANQPRDFDRPGNTFIKNIVYAAGNVHLFRVIEEDGRNNVEFSDYNLFYTDNPGNPNWNLDWWKEKYDFDRNSLAVDPLFVDYANDGFTLKPESPAFDLGFEQIDLSSAGPRP